MLIGADERARVGDFGLVAASGPVLDALPVSSVDPSLEADGAVDWSGITRSGTVMGTPKYMSPEQFLGVELDARSDQFSFF